MAVYKQKTKQYIINPAKQPIYFIRDGYIIFNLNSCFVKKNNYTRFQTSLTEAQQFANKLNLCNLASLCYKIEMDYCSDETLEFIARLVDIIKDTDLQITQDNILSHGETDMKPLDNLITNDTKSNVIYTNNVLIECLKILGYAESQMTSVIEFSKDLRKIIPEDLIEELPITSKKTNNAYKKIRSLLF